MGYLQEQSTCPQTLGYSLADSPVGLLAWIYEKLVAWTDNYPWTDDEGGSLFQLHRRREPSTLSPHIVLTWVSIYWFSRPGPAASVRIYYEASNAKDWESNQWVPLPTGISYFPRELVRLPNL